MSIWFPNILTIFFPFQPSSSARSAELLSTSNPFELSENVANPVFGMISLTPEQANLIPDELKMVLKKLSKKDTTTKLKVRCETFEKVDLADNTISKLKDEFKRENFVK